MQFRDIPGLDEVKQRLIANVRNGRIPHAQLFLGPEGSANLSLALAFVQYVACENKNEYDSCGICNSCYKMGKLIHPDMHFSYPTVSPKKLATESIEKWREALEANPYLDVYQWLRHLDAENKQGNITADECRDIIRRLSLKSFESEYRFLILWMPEYLGKEGNTLLKLIEEPPGKTLFLLVANDQEEIIGTIRSRTQVVKVPRFGEEEIAAFLMERQLAGETQSREIAFMCEGDMNRAIQMSAREETGFFPLFRQWLLDCYGRKIADMLGFAEKSAGMGRENLKQFLEYGVRMLREVLVYHSGAPELLRVRGQEKEFAEKFSALCDAESLEKMTGLLGEYAYYIERNANPKIALFQLSLRIKTILASSKAKLQVR